MFESGMPPDLNADLRAAADRAFGVLRTAADALVAMLPAGKRPPALMMSLHVWSMAQASPRCSAAAMPAAGPCP